MFSSLGIFVLMWLVVVLRVGGFVVILRVSKLMIERRERGIEFLKVDGVFF